MSYLLDVCDVVGCTDQGSSTAEESVNTCVEESKRSGRHQQNVLRTGRWCQALLLWCQTLLLWCQALLLLHSRQCSCDAVSYNSVMQMLVKPACSALLQTV